ncbi:Shedu immune nuclease family protein [Microbacterium oleivorans]|nr:Shedu immune nuclease family protein [Microbacterium oleivorans]
MREIDWDHMMWMSKREDFFDVTAGDFATLEIRKTDTPFCFFFDRSRKRLVKQFLLHESAQVVLLCEVKLVAKEGTFSPRFRLSRATKAKLDPVTEELSGDTTAIRASVSTDGGHENFAALMKFVLGFQGVESGAESFRVVALTDAEIVDLLRERERSDAIQMLSRVLSSALSEREIALLSGRKEQVERFERLLFDEAFFQAEQLRLNKTPEALWQSFFQAATWIFGYGLSLVSHEALATDGKLEQMTTGANIWSGGGKRNDAVMRSRAAISTLLFCEIKRHDTPLLRPKRYRDPDVYTASDELVGGVAQLQKTVRKAYRSLKDQIESHTGDDGTPTGLDFSTTKARQVLLAGSLSEFRTEHGVNGEKVESFELFRKAHHDIEVVTFDELFERARYILTE